MTDVIVIGAGGGGATAAKELAARGLDVLVLEAGPRRADPETEWTQFENDANNPITGMLRAGPEARSDAPWLRDLRHNGFVWTVSGVGGTTVNFFGNCPRATPGVFAGYTGPDSDAYDTAHRFPFSYEDLRPYYEWCETTLPVLPAPVGTKESVFLRGARALGLPHRPGPDVDGPAHRAQANCILQPEGNAGRTADPDLLHHPDARGCTMCGHCYQGCVQPRSAPRNLKAKRSTDNSYVPMMLTADAWAPRGRPARLLTDVAVHRILTRDEDGTTVATGVEYRAPDGSTVTEDAAVVVLAAGAVDSPRLWLQSELPNPNDWVGRGLTDHHMDAVVGVFDEYTGQSRGPGSNARVDLPGHGAIENVGMPPALAAYALGYSDSGTAGVTAPDAQADPAGADTVGRLVGTDLLDALADVDRTLIALVITDDDVDPEHRVELTTLLPPSELGYGALVSAPSEGRSERTRRNREHVTRTAVDLMRAAGARRVHRVDWPPLVLHAHSTLRMGTDEADSVLDHTGEARWVKRLFVTDNSALANGLGGANPTLTTQAVATRTCEHIVTTYFGGAPWVGREDPVSSVDDRVTRAVLARGL